MSIHWFIFIAGVIVFLQGRMFRMFGQKRLEYERYFNVRACYVGEEAEMVERLSNRKPLPVPWLRLESLIHAGLRFYSPFQLEVVDGTYFQYHKSFFSLMPYTQITRRHKVVCEKRGCYRLSSATLTCGDPLGLFTASTRLTLDTELLVYPRPIPLEDIELPSHSWQGDFTVRRWIVDDPFVTAGTRDYRFGDPLNGINWKATARTGRLQVHQRDFTADHRVMIYVNSEDHALMWDQVNDEELIEEGIAYAAALIQYAVAQGLETGFGTNAYTVDAPKEPVRIEPQRGEAHTTYLLDTLARLVVARSIPFDTFLEEEAARHASNLDILIVSAYVSDKMKPPMERLRQIGNSVTVIPLRKRQDAAAVPEAASAEAGESA
ncbi:DUF58 domain-containing protein [Paenibacillus thalictri]|uniref:DUF58 domain-containing protein n=1 Tax=Paenibacillus thalictri TaxID=2527873 RepID=A0A4V6MSF2_9BACL|nr:DUF58 domain-containing protein [Paenibacillus thalictri]TBL75386.1 DUF58 domain-containing protein [Paenibacillus thalictri]